MGQYQTRTKSIDEEQASGTLERGPTDGAPPPVFWSPIDSRWSECLNTSVVVISTERDLW